MATMQLPAMGYGLRYEYGIFRQTFEDGWQREQPDNWLRRPDPWEVARPQETVEIRLGCSFEVRGGSLGVVTGRPSCLLGVPYDRPVAGYGGKTVNALRLWAAGAPDVFDFQAFSAVEFVSAHSRMISRCRTSSTSNHRSGHFSTGRRPRPSRRSRRPPPGGCRSR
jgi:starch phosphorylase